MSIYDRAVQAVEDAGENAPGALVTAILAYFSRVDLIDFVERYIDDTIDSDEDKEDDDEDEDGI